MPRDQLKRLSEPGAQDLARGLPQTTHPILDACAKAGLGIQEHSSTLEYSQIDYRPIDRSTDVAPASWGDLKRRFR